MLAEGANAAFDPAGPESATASIEVTRKGIAEIQVRHQRFPL